MQPPLLHNVPGGRCPGPRSFFSCLVPVIQGFPGHVPPRHAWGSQTSRKSLTREVGQTLETLHAAISIFSLAFAALGRLCLHCVAVLNPALPSVESHFTTKNRTHQLLPVRSLRKTLNSEMPSLLTPTDPPASQGQALACQSLRGSDI